MGMLFVESIKRLYQSNQISKEKVLELYKSKKITEDEMNYIFEVEFESEVE